MVIIAVSGFALEWIEIVAITHNLNTQESPASRWSGLKYHLMPAGTQCLYVSGFALEWIEMKITMPTYYIVRSPASRWSELKYATSASNLGQLRLQLRAEADRNACRNTTTVLGIVFSFTPKAVTIVLTLNTPDKIRTLKLTST